MLYIESLRRIEEMVDTIRGEEAGVLKEMKKRIDEIERAAHELKELGTGVPVVEKNVRIITSITHALKFGISDLAEIMD